MSTPTRSTVENANLSPMAAQGATLETYATSIEDEVDELSRRIHGLDWKGTAKTAAEGRADSEVLQQKRLAEAVRDLKDAIVDGKNAMQPMIDSLKMSSAVLRASSYDVSQSWHVSDLLNYVAAVAAAEANDDEEQLRRLEELRTKRAEEAANETTRLQRLATELGTADENTRAAIDSAAAAIGGLSPVTAGLNGSQAHADLEAAQDGVATPEQLARLQAATTLTPEQLDALANGNPTQLPKGQYDYLNQLMRDMDGLSPAQIQDLADNTPGAQASIANALQIMSNPKVRGAMPDETGGMARLPDKVQQALRQYPVKDRYLVKTEKATDILGNSTTDKTYTAAVEIVGYEDLNSLSSLLASGDASLREGTDLDRGLLKQSAEIAAVVTAASGTPIVDESGAILSDAEINRGLDGMLDVASTDHQAIRDFLTGDNMTVTVEQGGVYDPNAHFMGLVTHEWGDEDGPIKMFDWIAPSASDPGFEGRMSADVADSLAHLLSTNHATLGQDVAPTSATQTVGQVNPELTQAFTKSLIPYLGGLAGVDIAGVQEISGFESTQELAQLIKVLDSDPTSAGAVNIAGSEWTQHLANLYGQSGDLEYARAAGLMTQAYEAGNDAEIVALANNERWDALAEYNEKSARWDSIRNLVTAAAAPVPGVGLLAGLYDGADPLAKLDHIATANDPNMESGNPTRQAVVDARDLHVYSTDRAYLNFAVLQGYLEANQDEQTNPDWDALLTDGKLDWKKYSDSANANAVIALMDSRKLDRFGSLEFGYDAGLNSSIVNLENEAGPEGSADAPR